MSIICSFFGHRVVADKVFFGLYDEIEKHITKYKVNVFYVGGYGGFDNMVFDILYEMKEYYSHIKIYRILAYMPLEVNNKTYEKHYKTMFPEGLELVPKKFAIVHRNRWIVNNSDYIIGYVQTSYGGAYEALKYAKRKNKKVINLAEGVK